jgi:hypothetical protein
MRFKAPHVIFRNGHPYFMMRVPADLVGKFNMRFIKKTLKTSNPSEAKLLASSMALKVKSSFTLLRSGVLSSDQEQSLISAYSCKSEKPSKRKSVRLSDLYDLYRAEKSPNWVGRTPGEINAQFEGIIKVMGDDPAEHYDRAGFIDGRDKLLERLSTRTVNKYMALLSSVLRWGVKHDYIPRNHAEGLQLDLKKRADEERKAYDLKDIQRVIQNLPPTDCSQPWKFWIPMIAMYSGMRREEICQLHAEDIKEIGGIWCFDINDKGGKSLKTKSSDRLVPIHSILIKHGFLAFVEATTINGNLWEFSQWKTTWGKQFGNWWSLRFNRQYVSIDPLTGR